MKRVTLIGAGLAFAVAGVPLFEALQGKLDGLPHTDASGERDYYAEAGARTILVASTSSVTSFTAFYSTT